MEKRHFDSLMAGLEEAAAFVRGDKSKCREVVIEIPDPVPEYKAEDIVRTRKSLNLSRSRLAYAMGVSADTVEEWEAGKTSLSGTARNLLYLIDNDPTLLRRLVPSRSTS